MEVTVQSPVTHHSSATHQQQSPAPGDTSAADDCERVLRVQKLRTMIQSGEYMIDETMLDLAASRIIEDLGG